MTYSVKDLEAAFKQLPLKDRDFAASLIAKGRQYELTTKQAFWVDKLTKVARGEEKPREAVQVGDLQKAIALFDKARERLPWPKVIVRVADTDVRLSVASEKAKVPGSLNVASLARFGEGEWYGRITRDGVFHPSPAAGSLPNLVEVLKAFAEEPAVVAAAYGKLVGRCCFCHLPLGGKEDGEQQSLVASRSTAVGFGEICSRKWGLHDQWKAAASFLEREAAAS